MTADRTRTQSALLSGQVVAGFGRSYRVELPDGTLVECATRGKKSDIACGDRVTLRCTSDNNGVIESVAARTTLLYRSDAHRQKLIAANVTQAVIVVAAVPSFYDDLINRCLAACEHGGIAPLIVLNKTDLPRKLAVPTINAPLVDVCCVSGNGIEQLKDAIKSLVWSGAVTDEMAQVNINSRHQDALRRAREAVQLSLDALRADASLEFVALDLRIGANAVGEVVGKTTTEDLLDSIFSTFCLGK